MLNDVRRTYKYLVELSRFDIMHARNFGPLHRRQSYDAFLMSTQRGKIFPAPPGAAKHTSQLNIDAEQSTLSRESYLGNLQLC